MPPELSALLLEHKTRLGAIRRWRGLSSVALAQKAGLSEDDVIDFDAPVDHQPPESVFDGVAVTGQGNDLVGRAQVLRDEKRYPRPARPSIAGSPCATSFVASGE